MNYQPQLVNAGFQPSTVDLAKDLSGFSEGSLKLSSAAMDELLFEGLASLDIANSELISKYVF